MMKTTDFVLDGIGAVLKSAQFYAWLLLAVAAKFATLYLIALAR